MSADDPPDEISSDPPPRESVRSRFESIVPELLKRAVELGVEKARESPDNLKQFVHDLKVPKEIAHLLFQQIDDTKSGLFRVVANELRDFLERTNFSGEVQKLLTTVQFEINTTIRFTPNDGREARQSDAGAENPGPDDARPKADPEPGLTRPLPIPDVKTSVHVRRDDRERDHDREAGERKRRGSRNDA